MKAIDMRAVIDRTVYDTRTATLLADDAWWDGHNFERHGRNTFLYRAKNGAFFVVHCTCWEGEHDSLEPLTGPEAEALYETLAQSDHEALPFEQAFPGVQLQEA